MRTTNEHGKARTDIPKLWEQFFSKNIIDKIPNKIGNTLYCIYTDYEKDHTKPYITLLGCKVSNLDFIPEGLTGKTFDGGNYSIFTAKGKITDGIVFEEWLKIWNSDTDRVYTADFEVYDTKAQDPDNTAIDIFVAIK